MENLQHTPGPWQACSYGIFAKIGIIAECGTRSLLKDGQTEDVALANARLIAAAPELLDAVLAALPYIEDLEHHNIADAQVGIFADKELTRALSAMVAAIEKAKGLTAPQAAK